MGYKKIYIRDDTDGMRRKRDWKKERRKQEKNEVMEGESENSFL